MSKALRAAIWWLVAAGLVALTVWKLLPEASPPARLVRAAVPWAMPMTPPATNSSAAAAQVATSQIWGKRAAPGAPPEEDLRWAITGSYVTDGVGTAVIRFASKRPELLVRKGDRLPGGEEVVEIEIDRVCVAAGKKRECRPIVPVKPLDF